MHPLKNLAGNDVSIFLFRFDITANGLDFVMNEGIAADMYEDVNGKLMPLVHACCETLSRYKELSVAPTIMDGNILFTGEFEVMLSRGLGKYFPETEKQALFQDAKKIADLLAMVMDRRTREAKKGKRPNPNQHPSLDPDSNPSRKPPFPPPPDPAKLKRGLEKLGEDKRLQAEAQWAFEGKRRRPGLKPLRPQDLPLGVKASRGYDQRGHCLAFEHETLGELGKIVLIKLSEENVLIQADIHIGRGPADTPTSRRKRRLFEQVVKRVNDRFQENFPE